MAAAIKIRAVVREGKEDVHCLMSGSWRFSELDGIDVVALPGMQIDAPDDPLRLRCSFDHLNLGGSTGVVSKVEQEMHDADRNRLLPYLGKELFS